MKKIKEFIAIVKIELIICIAVPFITAVLLSQSQTLSNDIFYMSMVGLFCILTYGLIKMYFRLKKKDVIVSEENLNKPKSTKYRVFVFIAAIILPLAGLSLNNGFVFMSRGDGGIFGDFSSPWFFIIAVLNGTIMLIDIKVNKRSLALFYLKIVGFTYISYFAIIT